MNMPRPLLSEAEAMSRKGYVPALEVARRLSRGKKTIYDWIRGGKVRAVRIGYRRYVLWQSVLDYYESTDPAALKLLGLR